MLKKSKTSDLVSTVSFNFINLLSGLFIFPIFLYFLKTKEIGEWYLYLTLYTVLALGDFGLTSYLSRNITYLLAKSLNKKDCIRISFDLEDLLQNAFFLFIFFSITILFVSSFLILPYLNYFIFHNKFIYEFNSSWFLYAIGIAIVNFSNFYNSILKGYNRINKIQTSLIWVKIFSLIISFLFFKIGFGLNSLVFGFVFSSALQLFLLRFKSNKVHNFQFNFKYIKCRHLIFIFRQSVSFFYMSLGTILIFQSLTILIATFLGVEVLASYSFTVQILNFLIVFSTMYLNINIPELSFLYASNSDFRIFQILSLAHILNLTIYFVGIILIYFLSPLLFELLGKNNLLLNGWQFLILVLIYFFESNMNLSTTFLVATNSIPFLKSSLVSGFAVSFFTYLLLSYLNVGLMVILLVQFAVQSSFNYWYWTRFVFVKYSINFNSLLNCKLPNNA